MHTECSKISIDKFIFPKAVYPVVMTEVWSSFAQINIHSTMDTYQIPCKLIYST